MFSYLGIDVSKDSLEIRILPEDIGMSYANNCAGFKALIDWLKPYNVRRVLLEATGGYERAAMKSLQAVGLDVLRINPRRVKSFAEAMGYRA
ncbi:IS110 family transposase, partial [Pseudomonas poae]